MKRLYIFAGMMLALLFALSPEIALLAHEVKPPKPDRIRAVPRGGTTDSNGNITMVCVRGKLYEIVKRDRGGGVNGIWQEVLDEKCVTSEDWGRECSSGDTDVTWSFTDDQIFPFDTVVDTITLENK